MRCSAYTRAGAAPLGTPRACTRTRVCACVRLGVCVCVRMYACAYARITHQPGEWHYGMLTGLLSLTLVVPSQSSPFDDGLSLTDECGNVNP